MRMSWVGDKNKPIRFGSVPDADLAYQSDAKHKLFNLAEVCTHRVSSSFACGPGTKQQIFTYNGTHSPYKSHRPPHPAFQTWFGNIIILSLPCASTNPRYDLPVSVKRHKGLGRTHHQWIFILSRTLVIRVFAIRTLQDNFSNELIGKFSDCFVVQRHAPFLACAFSSTFSFFKSFFCHFLPESLSGRHEIYPSSHNLLHY